MEKQDSEQGSRLSRRRFMVATAATAVAGLPAFLRAQPAPVKVGIMHPITGFLSYSGNQCRAGALMAVEEINASGGIKALGGAKIEPLLADSQSKVDVGASEFERMNEAGISAFVGPYASAIGIATSQAATRYGLPHICDVTVSDRVVGKDKPTTFRFSPGYSAIAETAISRLDEINKSAGSIAKKVMMVHEESESGAGTQKMLAKELPKHGFEIVETVLHPNPTRDFSNIVLRIRARNADILIIGNYYDEYVLLVRTLRQQRVRLKGIYSVLGGGASSFRFLRESPEAAQHIMDTNHWYNPLNPKALDLRKRVEAKGLDFSYEVFLNYNAVMWLADSIERARSVKREAIVEALATSTWSGHILPYGPTKIADGQNTGALASTLQVQGNDIQVILPKQFASAKIIFPTPA